MSGGLVFLVVGVGSLDMAAWLGLGFLINVLFQCILTAVGYHADSQCHGPVVNRAKPLESLYCEAVEVCLDKKCNNEIQYSSNSLAMMRSETGEAPSLVTDC